MPGSPSLKYAHVESERKFLVDGIPPEWQGVGALRIQDRYISGTRLRLRKVDAPGGHTVWKLGQKIRFDPLSQERVAHTTIYLDEVEATSLAVLPGDELTKLRRTREVEGHLWSVDEFSGPLTGLFLVEIDLGEDRQMPAVLPFEPRLEVTTDDRFSGGQLAQMSADRLKTLLGSRLQ